MSRASQRTVGAIAILLLTGCREELEQTPGPPKPKADLSLSSSRAKVGEPVDLVVTVEHPDDTDALFPPVEAELGGLEVVEAGEVTSDELEPGVKVTSRTTTLRGFRTGGYTVGPLDIRLRPTDEPPTDDAARPGTVRSVRTKVRFLRTDRTVPGRNLTFVRVVTTPKARLEVYSVLAKGSTLDDLRDEAGPFELPPEPVRWGTYLAWSLSLAVLLAAGMLVLARAVARRAERLRSPPPPPAHEVALAELRAVRESGLLEDGRVAEYTDRVSDVLRRYLEARFALPAPERTTEEFLDEVARAPVLDRKRKQFLADYLARCDLVKFAAQDPGRRELEELYESSVGFVEETALTRGALFRTAHSNGALL